MIHTSKGQGRKAFDGQKLIYTVAKFVFIAVISVMFAPLWLHFLFSRYIRSQLPKFENQPLMHKKIQIQQIHSKFQSLNRDKLILPARAPQCTGRCTAASKTAHREQRHTISNKVSKTVFSFYLFFLKTYC
jgi:hypothetical protein